MKEELLHKIYGIAIAILVIVSLDLLIDLIGITSTKSSTSTSTTSTTTEETSSDYDVSMFNTVTVSDMLKMFEDGKTHVVYLGRSTCSACVAFLPTLQAVQKEYNTQFDYLDITTVDTSSDDFTTLMNKLSTSITETINGEEQTGKISEFYGYTPMVIVIQKKKAVDASIGSYPQEDFESFLNSYNVD